jgi:hypothetical protein
MERLKLAGAIVSTGVTALEVVENGSPLVRESPVKSKMGYKWRNNVGLVFSS